MNLAPTISPPAPPRAPPTTAPDVQSTTTSQHLRSSPQTAQSTMESNAASTDGGSAAMEPTDERVARITNTHFQTNATDVRQLFEGFNTVDQVRSVRSVDHDGLTTTHYVLFPSKDDRDFAIQRVRPFMRGCKVEIEAASEGTYKLRMDQAGFDKRFAKKAYKKRRAESLARNEVAHGPSPLGTSRPMNASSIMSPPGTSLQVPPATPASRPSTGRDGLIFAGPAEDEMAWMPELNEDTKADKNHYDKAPCVFGSIEYRRAGWNSFLQEQDAKRTAAFEENLRRGETQGKAAPSRVVDNNRRASAKYDLTSAASPPYGPWNLEGKVGSSHQDNLIKEEAWHNFWPEQSQKIAADVSKMGSVVSRLNKEGGIIDDKQ